MITDTLNEQSRSHDPSLSAFCRFVLEHMSEFPDMSVDEIAQGCFVSRGQISKLIHKLNYAGMEEFKDDVRDYNHSLSEKPACLNTENDLLLYLKQEEKAVHTLSENFPYEKLQELIQKIREADTIYIFGHGDTRVHCLHLLNILQAKGRKAVLLEAHYAEVPFYQANDLLLILSCTGSSFRYHPSMMHRILKAPVSKILLTCGKAEQAVNTILLPSAAGLEEVTMRTFLDCIGRTL